MKEWWVYLCVSGTWCIARVKVVHAQPFFDFFKIKSSKKCLFFFIFSNNHQCNYTKTISRLRANSHVAFHHIWHLSWTFSPCNIWLLLRRLWSKFKGAFLTITLFKDLVIRTWGPLLTILRYITLVHVARNCLVLILWKLVPLFIIYDVICMETSNA